MIEPARADLPSTLQRSNEQAQDTYAATLASAVQEYGDGERAHRTAWSAVKHTQEKVGDHWEPKEHAGPSDAQAEQTSRTRRRDRPTAGGVNAAASKAHLYDLAKRAEIAGRSRMDKDELVAALQKHNDRATAAARADR